MVQVETPRPYAKQGWWLSDWVSQKSALQEETQILKKLTGAMEFFLNLTPVLDYRCIQSRKVWRKEGEKSSTHNPKRTHPSVGWIRWLSTNLVLPLPSCGILGSFVFPLGLIFLIHKMDVMVIVPTSQDYVKNLPAVRETWVWSLGREDPLEKEMATHSSILAWRMPWTQAPGRLQSVGLQELDTT